MYNIFQWQNRAVEIQSYDPQKPKCVLLDLYRKMFPIPGVKYPTRISKFGDTESSYIYKIYGELGKKDQGIWASPCRHLNGGK